MGRPKKQIKAKEPVRLRKKVLKNGNTSLFLDIYSGGIRKYEYLKLYLVPEVSDSAKDANMRTLQVAEQIKAERIIALQSRGIGHWDEITASRMSLVSWLKKEESDSARFRKATLLIRRECRKHVEDFLGSIHKPFIGLDEIDVNFCMAFIAYLRKTTNRRVKSEEERSLTQNTQHSYQKVMIAAINHAVKEGYMDKNPFYQIPKNELLVDKEGKREFLTIEEVKALIDNDCPREDVRVAFLFSCFTGLRLSDIMSLRPCDFRLSADGVTLFIDKNMMKTGEEVIVPLSKEAKKWLPEKTNTNGYYFPLPAKATLHRVFKQWAKDAGINKKVTFHVARHTFATTILTLGADIYTTSKLLGHHSLKTTEIYAKVVDSKKIESVNLLDGMFNQIRVAK